MTSAKKKDRVTNGFITFVISLLLLNAVEPKGMLPLDAILILGLVILWAIYRPKKPKPQPPTIADVWHTIASAQKTVDDSMTLVYGSAMRYKGQSDAETAIGEGLHGQQSVR